MNPTSVKEVVGYKQQRWPWSAFAPTEADFCNVVAEVARNGETISIAGKRHSQGGHTFYTGSVVLDITDFDQILAFDADAKTIRVQSGTTWDMIQRFAQPHRLSVSVMQAYPFFTVGGSLGVSVHESDLRFGTIIETVLSFRILLADGRVLDVSRDENAELFGLVIGGYGLFGLVLEVELQLTDDILLTQTVKTVASTEFTDLFLAAKATKGTIYGYARPCFVDDDRLMTQMSMVTYAEADTTTPPPGIFDIADMSYLGLRKLIYDLSRSYERMTARAAEFEIALPPRSFVFSNEIDGSKSWYPDWTVDRLVPYKYLVLREGREGRHRWVPDQGLPLPCALLPTLRASRASPVVQSKARRYQGFRSVQYR